MEPGACFLEEALGALAERLKANPEVACAGIHPSACRVSLRSKLCFRDAWEQPVTTTEDDATFSVQRRVQNGVVSLNDLESLKQSDCVVAVGVDLFSSHQVTGFFLKRNLPLGTRLVVIDPLESKMAAAADVFLQLSGTDNKLLMVMAGDRRNGRRSGEIFVIDWKNIPWMPSAGRQSGFENDNVRMRLDCIGERSVFVYGKGLPRLHPKAGSLIALAKTLGVKSRSIRWECEQHGSAPIGLDQDFEPKAFTTLYLALE
jgi:hypothetical protein